MWLSYSIYQQIRHQGDVQQSWQLIREEVLGPAQKMIWLVVLLMLVNYGLEAVKWKRLMRGVQEVSFFRAFRAVLSGQALGFNTLNRVGESAGRAFFLEEGNRIRGILLSVVGSMSQIIVTFVAGWCCLFYMRQVMLDETHHLNGLSGFWIDALLWLIGIGIVLLILLYFRLSWLLQWLEKIPFIAKHAFFLKKIEELHWKDLTGILLLSLTRYVVFVIQYVLLLQVFEVQIAGWPAAVLVCVMLLVLAIVPTIALAELGFRGKLSLSLFGLYSTNTLGIVATAAGIWIINLMIPAVAGAIFILGVRLFRNK
jgi:MFS family permease